MNRIKEVGSVFGNVQRTSYDYMKLLDKTYKDGYRVLIIDDKDGLNSIPFAKHGAKVTMYESDIGYIDGGEIDGIVLNPISNRKYWDKVKNNITIKNANFDSKLWNVKSLIEFTNDSFHKGHPNHKNDHYHRVGHIFAQKKNTRLVHKYYYDIEIIFE